MKRNIEVVNRKAFHDYFIEEKYEAGIVLTGTEIKSIRAGKVNITDGFVRVERGEVMLHNVHISPYEKGNYNNHDPLRTRKLLLHKREISKLAGAIQRQGYTIIPLRVYITHGLCKVEIALAKGKKLYDKREAEKKKTAQREIERSFREKHK